MGRFDKCKFLAVIALIFSACGESPSPDSVPNTSPATAVEKAALSDSATTHSPIPLYFSVLSLNLEPAQSAQVNLYRRFRSGWTGTYCGMIKNFEGLVAELSPTADGRVWFESNKLQILAPSQAGVYEISVTGANRLSGKMRLAVGVANNSEMNNSIPTMATNPCQ